MNKPILVVTHERSGTHLLINTINYHNDGYFKTIGRIPRPGPYTLEEYKWQYYKDIIAHSHVEYLVCKSHHQVEFAEPYLDFIFSTYKVIYVKRDVKDVLWSYYKFIPSPKDKDKFPKFEDWIFEKPDEIGRKFLHPYSPDPHIIVEPKNYLDRWKIHVDGWMKYKENLLLVNYEDILTNFENTKLKIEDWIGKKIGDSIPDINNKNLPNFNPGKGVVGSHKEIMDENLINKIDNYFI